MYTFAPMRIGTFILLGVVLLFAACRKEQQITTDPAAKLSFSKDTVIFDTVFTTVGSATRSFKIYNRNDQAVEIDRIALAGGNNSKFRLNINGTPYNELNNIVLDGGDSIYVFAEVTIDPNNDNNPLILEDSVICNTNGNQQSVILEAWGQDAYFHYPDTDLTDSEGNVILRYSIIDCNDVWLDDKPHVIYGFAVVDTDCQLDITAGTNVHLHDQAVLWVFNGGTLKIRGQEANHVLIQGDRLEPEFEEEPGQWGFIWLSSGSRDNEIEYATIKNGTVGLRVDTVPGVGQRNLTIRNSIIRNMASVGILGQGTDLLAQNVEIGNCGIHNVVCQIGGRYRFEHCTMSAYWVGGSRGTPAVLLNNWYEDINGNIIPRDLEEAYFGNCIIYGNNTNELGFDRDDDRQFEYFFEHSIIRLNQNDYANQPWIDFSDPTQFDQISWNVDPKFVDPFNGDNQLDTLSGAQSIAKLSLSQQIPFDLLGKPRLNDIGPDLGAYERQE